MNNKERIELLEKALKEKDEDIRGLNHKIKKLTAKIFELTKELEDYR